MYLHTSYLSIEIHKTNKQKKKIPYKPLLGDDLL